MALIATDKYSLPSPAVRLLVLTAVAGLLYWAWRDVSLAAVVSAVFSWGWRQWGLYAAANLFILGAMCWRWYIILRRMGYTVSLTALVACRMGANTLSYITPGPQFGGEPFQVLCLVGRHPVGAEAAAASVAVDRLMELMGNLLFLAVAGLIMLPKLIGDTSALGPLMAMVIGTVLILFLWLHATATGLSPLSRLVAAVMRRIRWSPAEAGWLPFVQAGERQAAGILTKRLWGWYAFGGLLQWSGFLAELWLIYAFMGVVLNVSALITVAVAARLAFLLPLPGGLGALEAGQMIAITVLGGDPSSAAAACGIMRTRDLVLISLGGVLAVRGLRTYKKGNP